jgi:hypothetical protein
MVPIIEWTGPESCIQAAIAHARRKFFDAVKLNPKDQTAIGIVAQMDQLFAIDAQARAQKLTQSDRHRRNPSISVRDGSAAARRRLYGPAAQYFDYSQTLRPARTCCCRASRLGSTSVMPCRTRQCLKRQSRTSIARSRPGAASTKAKCTRALITAGQFPTVGHTTITGPSALSKKLKELFGRALLTSTGDVAARHARQRKLDSRFAILLVRVPSKQGHASVKSPSHPPTPV